MSSPTFHKATDLFAILSFRFHIVELTEFEFLHTKLLRLSFTYRQSLPSVSHCEGPPACIVGAQGGTGAVFVQAFQLFLTNFNFAIAIFFTLHPATQLMISGLST